MAAKFKYTATFSDGTTVTRTSHRTYTHAWRVTYKPTKVPLSSIKSINQYRVEWNASVDNGVIHSDTGFSSSADLAQRAARSAVNNCHAIVEVFVVPVTVL